jgi:tetratricopeptide (TPR) repeat protein
MENAWWLKILLWLKGNWYETFTLIVLLPLSFWVGYKATNFLLIGSPYAFLSGDLWWASRIVGLILAAIIFFIWLLSRRYPKAHKDKVGIIIAIRSNTLEAERIRNDVVEKFLEIMKGSGVSKYLDLLVLKDFQAKKVIDEKSALGVSNKCAGAFVIWGKSLSYRVDNGNNQYGFDLSYQVRHKPLVPPAQAMVAQGFQEALVNKKWEFLEKDTLRGIRITAANIREVALYVIGIAAYVSYDFSTSKDFHLEVYKLLSKDKAKEKSLSPVFQRVPIFISDSLHIIGYSIYLNEKDVDKALGFAEQAITFWPQNANAHTNKALYLFQLGDIEGAKKTIKKVRQLNAKIHIWDSAWRYSEAFLLFLDKKFPEGFSSYKKAFNGYTSDRSVDEVVTFLEVFLKNNPDKAQLIFALALIRLYKKDDKPKALEEFETFMEQTQGSAEFSFLFKKAEAYKNQITKNSKTSIANSSAQ